MKELEDGKISVKKIVSDSLSLYRENFKSLFVLSFIIVALSYVFVYLLEELINPYLVIIGFTPTMIKIVFILFAFLMIHFLLRLKIAIYLYIQKKYRAEEINVVDAYKKSKGRVWILFTTYIGLGFLMIVPGVFISISRFNQPLIVKGIFFVIGLSAAIFVLSKNGLTPVIRSIEPERKASFGYNSDLVNGNIKQMVIIIILANIGMGTNYVINHMYELGLIRESLQNISTALIALFYTPLESSILVITFLRLADTFNENEKLDVISV